MLTSAPERLKYSVFNSMSSRFWGEEIDSHWSNEMENGHKSISPLGSQRKKKKDFKSLVDNVRIYE